MKDPYGSKGYVGLCCKNELKFYTNKQKHVIFNEVKIDKVLQPSIVVMTKGPTIYAPFRLRQIISINGQKTLRNYIRECVRVFKRS